LKTSSLAPLAFLPTRPGLILAVAVAVEVALFIDYHCERWHKALAPLDRAATRAGEGLVIRSDGLGYYAWLRSLLIDGDWAFDNEFDEHNPLHDFVPPAHRRTALGRRPNQWSVGPAGVWSLVVVPGHGCWRLLGDTASWPADGYSLPYQLMVGGTTLLASILGLLLLYRLARFDAGPEAAAWAAALISLGTTIVYYAVVEVSMAHGLGTVAVAGLVWYWRRTYGSTRWPRWLGVGLLLGTAALVRWQLVTFAVLPAGEACWTAWKCRRTWMLLLVAAAGAWIAFVPQMIAWRSVYGQWLASPMPTAHNWTRPALFPVLWAQDRGLFSWTPLALVAFLGTLGFAVKGMWQTSTGGEDPRPGDSAPAVRNQALVLLLAAFALQVYVLASLFGAHVTLSASFGFRYLTEVLVALVPGLALLLERVPKRAGRLLVGVGCLLVLWNLVLISQYRYGWIPADAGADLSTLLANTWRLAWRKKFLFVQQAVLGPALLALVLLWGRFLTCLSFGRLETCPTRQRQTAPIPAPRIGLPGPGLYTAR
jgi:hypothetical protein